MVDIQHKNITGTDAAHPPFYASESDPTTTLGAYRGWFKPSTGEAWIRNAANTAWISISSAGVEVSAASETTAGIAELATQAEIDTGTDDSRIVTPLKVATRFLSKTGGTLTGFLTLHAEPTSDMHAATKQYADELVAGVEVSTATEGSEGIAELATQTETDTGTDDSRIVTPLKAATRFLAKAGGTLTGFLTLHADPTSNMHAATKQYADALVVGGASPASETTAGIAELATQAETNTGTDDARIVTPLKLAARTATETRVGVVELATDGETQTGTDTARAITPANLSARSATETRAGIAEVATQAETDTGTDDARMVTPAKMAGRTATDTRAGVVELATDAETQTGTDTTRAITPANLAARTATETRAGVVELATDAETQTGTDTARAITPANLTARTPTETRAGVIEVATQAETNTGTDDVRAVTPLKLKTNVDLHINDTTDAHVASAISFSPAGSIAATNVQAAIEETASEAGGGGSAHIIKDEGSAMTQRANLNFIGSGVTVTDDAGNSETEVTIPGASAASETTAGVLEIATQGETDAGTDDTRAVTPAKLANYSGLGSGSVDLDDLTDVIISSPATDNVLVYNGTNWVNDTVSGGGSTVVTLGSDVSNSTTTMANVTGLSFSVSSGITYHFHAYMVVDTQATTTGCRFVLSGPATTLLSYKTSIPSAINNAAFNFFNSYSAQGAILNLAFTVGNLCEIHGVIIPSASGTLQVQFASEAPGTNNQVTVKAGSTLDWMTV